MISLSSFEKWMLTTLMWSKNLSLQLWSIFPPKLLSLIWSGFSKDIFSTIFFQKSYVSISSNPPTQYISNYKQLVVPTHPLFCLRNIWTAPKYILKPTIHSFGFKTNKISPHSVWEIDHPFHILKQANVFFQIQSD